MALEYFKASFFTSYSEIELNAPTLFLVIGKQNNLTGITFSNHTINEKKKNCKRMQKV